VGQKVYNIGLLINLDLYLNRRHVFNFEVMAT